MKRVFTLHNLVIAIMAFMLGLFSKAGLINWILALIILAIIVLILNIVIPTNKTK